MGVRTGEMGPVEQGYRGCESYCSVATEFHDGQKRGIYYSRRADSKNKQNKCIGVTDLDPDRV